MPDLVKLVVMVFVVACAEPEAVFESGETGTVVEITGPLSLVLDTRDGPFEIRLAELDVPESAAESARAWLLARLEGEAVRLGYDGLRRDRYDRAIAQAYRVQDGEWLQAALVEAGQARVLSHAGNRQAAAALLELEAAARRAGLGLWADPANHVRDTHPDALAQDIGSVQLVEGRVLEVTRLRSGRTYINFGTDYRTDFTLVVESDAEAVFDEAGRPLADLAGQRIRVRGWLEAENGPLIRIDHPERIERLEG
jgi:micrococcal nuclease